MLNTKVRFMSKDLATYLYNYTLQATGVLDQQQVLNSKVGRGKPIFDSLLETYKSKVEKIADKKLCPTYSLYRVYTHGQELSPHTDRKSCEISVSISLGGNLKNEWPLHIGDSSVSMKPGEAVVYRGTEVVHWREPLEEEGKHQSQLFLHYIDVNGPYYPEFKYDGREELASWKNLQEITEADRAMVLYPGGNF